MTFELAKEEEMNNLSEGTSLIGYMDLSPTKLIKNFGEPFESDGYKVSGEYVFVNRYGVVTLYDWKMTKLYDQYNDFTPEELWAQERPLNFHIGGKLTIENDFFEEGDLLKQFKGYLEFNLL